MPYLRLYLPEVSIAQKRHIARELLDTLVQSFPLAERHQINIQFLSRSRIRRGCKLEVRGRNLDPDSKRAFTAAVIPMLMRSLHLNVKNRLAWLMGGGVAMPPKVDVEFVELSHNAWDSGIKECSADETELPASATHHRNAA